MLDAPLATCAEVLDAPVASCAEVLDAPLASCAEVFEWCMSLGEAVTFAVRVRPGASRTSVGGRYDGALGAALVVAVSAPAVDGRATEAALHATAKALGLRRGAVALRTGETSRDKLFIVTDPPSDLTERLHVLRNATRRRGSA